MTTITHIIEWFTTIGVVAGSFIFLLLEMRRIEGKIDQQAIRSDRLYEMFIELLKEKKTN